MSWNHSIPKYLHREASYLWFDVTEWLLVLIPFFAGLAGSSAVLLVVPLIPWKVLPRLRKQPRNFVMHRQIQIGLVELTGYPSLIPAKYQK